MHRYVEKSGIIAALSILLMSGNLLPATEPLPPDVQATYERMVTRALNFLATKGRAADGSYSSFSGPGVTALVTAGLLQHGRRPDEPQVAESLKFLQGFVQPDGGIYQMGSSHQNYETSLAIMCFSAANRDGRYQQLLRRAQEFVIMNQWDEAEGTQISDAAYGGAGYGRSKRPDLSNTSFFMDALKTIETSQNSAAIHKALVFISRCQNLESEYNTTEFAAKNPDGGFYYTVAAGGSSMAGKSDNGGLRSYGSMTYAGLKSMIYAGLDQNDPRVKAAVEWVRKNYDLTANPGMGQAGLYYYYQTVAKALDAARMETIEDSSGKKHTWRAELIQQLAERQLPDGSWINATDRWMEGDANLVTGYVLLALVHCRPK